ncbi:MAG: pilin [Candidatus Pacebacteria bacterium]|nr:pilin [Candidatus Paceibacterota bacterium]MCF7856910.1 pilin [Candidatus Paceibacterota bacterium]
MNIQTFLANILKFLDGALIPFLLSIAFLIFVWNAARFFIFAGGSEEGHEKARSMTIWSISAFVIIISLWGIVNLLVSGLGFGNEAITPDYMKQKNTYPADNDAGYTLPSQFRTQ